MADEPQGGNAPDAAAGIQASIAQALEKSGYDANAVEDDDRWDNAGLDSPEGTSSTVDATNTDGEASGASDGTEEVPTVYWGQDLSDIPVERRKEIIAKFEQQDSTIQKLQEKLSTPEEPVAPAAAEDVDVEDVSDEDLLRAAGYDPEDFEVQGNAKFLVPQLRNQLALEDTVAALQRQVQGREAETAWNTQLDELETQYGKLPGDRVAVLQEAVKQGYATPFEAYFRLSAGPRREVENAATAARREAAKRQEGASPRPRSGGVEPDPVKEGMSLRDSVAAAMKGASQKTGLSWKKAVRGGYADNLLDR